MKDFIRKVRNRLWLYLVCYSRNKRFYTYLYRSYWHYRFSKNRNGDHTACYYTARQNPGAGIGHQMSNWLAGYWFARQFGLKFAHVPFPDREWEDFLGFGDNEERVKDLVKSGYRIRRLPLFEEHNPDETELIKAIIRSYSGKRVVFIAELDQFHRDLYSVMDDIRHKFHNAKARQSDRLIYSKEDFNIAVHVRRGDIVAGALAGDEGMLMRWQDNDYFVNVLSQILKIIHTGRHIVIHLFSQGKIDDFREFGRFENMQFHLDMNPLDSFLHMVHADLLVTGKSSFSYKPALLNKGIKLCPRDFWHGYPDDPQWILAESNGLFDANRLKSINL